VRASVEAGGILRELRIILSEDTQNVPVKEFLDLNLHQMAAFFMDARFESDPLILGEASWYQ
jgi:hypothetical protein